MATCKDCIHYGLCRYEYYICRDENGEAIQYQDSAKVEVDCEGFADKSRFIELPCRLGGEVYIITKGGYPYYGNDVNRHYHVEQSELSYAQIPYIGKSVFLHREEAEKALYERLHGKPNVERITGKK